MERLVIIVGVVLLVAGVAAAFLFGGGGQHPTTTVQANKEATITLTEYAINPNNLVIDHGRVKLTIVNRGKSNHEFIIHDPVDNTDLYTVGIGKQVPFLKPGASVTVWVDLVAFRRYEMYDPNYMDKGMQGAITVR